MPSHVDKAFNESMRRIMGPGWKPGGGNPGTKARKNRASSRARDTDSKAMLYKKWQRSKKTHEANKRRAAARNKK